MEQDLTHIIFDETRIHSHSQTIDPFTTTVVNVPSENWSFFSDEALESQIFPDIQPPNALFHLTVLPEYSSIPLATLTIPIPFSISTALGNPLYLLMRVPDECSFSLPITFGSGVDNWAVSFSDPQASALDTGCGFSCSIRNQNPHVLFSFYSAFDGTWTTNSASFREWAVGSVASLV